MKTKLTFIVLVALMVGACTTGTYTTKTYDDDIYFSPADVPPVVIADNESQTNEKSAKINSSDTNRERIVMSEMNKNEDGSTTLNNYVYQPERANSDVQSYQMDDQELVESDTTVYYNDDEVKYVINNYYDDDDMDFTSRIYRFHRPYWGSYSYFNDWYYGYDPYWGYGWNSWGWDPWYSGGWGYPYSHYGYYSPFSFGWSGYWGYGGGYYSPYYHSPYYYGYYGGYYGNGGGYYSDHKNRDNVRYGRSSDFSNYGGGGGGISRESSSLVNRSVLSEKNASLDRTIGNQSDTRIPSGASIGRTQRLNGQGQTNASNGRVSYDSRLKNARPNTNSSSTGRTYSPSTTGRTYNQDGNVRQSQNYTPSYSKPRIVNQSNYNSNGSNYTRPRTSDGNVGQTVKSANTQSQQNYSAPRSSSSIRQTYRSSSSYSSGSSNSSYRGSSSGYSNPGYSSPSYNNSSSSPSYSAPARSSSSSGSSGSYSGGSSSGSSSGGSGGRSGSGGRR